MFSSFKSALRKCQREKSQRYFSYDRFLHFENKNKKKKTIPTTDEILTDLVKLYTAQVFLARRM